MRKSKIVSGVLATVVLAGATGTALALNAASNTVKINGSKVTAAAGAEYSVEFSLADIPSGGVNACEFAVKYDSSLVSVTSVTPGALTQTGAETADSTSSAVPLFDYYVDTNAKVINIVWSTAAESPNLWLKGSGVLFTVSGTVNPGASSGAVANFQIAPINRDTFPGSGVKNTKIIVGNYNGTTKNEFTYSTSNGSVTVSGSQTDTMLGDINNDGKVTVEDVVLLRLHLLNSTKFPVSAAGLRNAQVKSGTTTISAAHAVIIQDYCVGVITTLPA